MSPYEEWAQWLWDIGFPADVTFPQDPPPYEVTYALTKIAAKEWDVSITDALYAIEDLMR